MGSLKILLQSLCYVVLAYLDMLWLEVYFFENFEHIFVLVNNQSYRDLEPSLFVIFKRIYEVRLVTFWRDADEQDYLVTKTV